MNIQITCKGIEHTDVLDKHIRKQLEKLVSFLSHDRDPSSIHVVLEGHPSHAHNEVHVHVTSPLYKVVAHREGPDIMIVVDQTIDIAYEDVLKQKDKRIHNRNNNGGHHRGV